MTEEQKSKALEVLNEFSTSSMVGELIDWLKNEQRAMELDELDEAQRGYFESVSWIDYDEYGRKIF